MRLIQSVNEMVGRDGGPIDWSQMYACERMNMVVDTRYDVMTNITL